MADFDFSHLAKQDQKDESKPFLIYEIGDEPTIHFRPATKANTEYWNEVLRRTDSGEAQKQIRKARKIKGRDEKYEREVKADNAHNFGHFCATGWEGVNDAKGNPVEFSAEACEAYLIALPDFVMDRLIPWITNPLNFVDSDPEEKGKQTGKSSPPA